MHERGGLIIDTHVGFWGDSIVERSLSIRQVDRSRERKVQSASIGNDAQIGGIFTTTDDATLFEGVRLRGIDSAGSVTIKPDAAIDQIAVE